MSLSEKILTEKIEDDGYWNLKSYFKPIIHSGPFWLEYINEQHAEEFFYVLDSNIKVRIFTFEKNSNSIKDSRRKIKGWLADGPRVDYVIREKGTARFIGVIGITIDDDNGAWLHYEISPHFWRRGIATKAGSVLLELTFSVPWITNLSATVIAYNESSISVLRKLSFNFVRNSEYCPFGDQFRIESFDVQYYQHNHFVK